jgi:hypothetical protein
MDKSFIYWVAATGGVKAGQLREKFDWPRLRLRRRTLGQTIPCLAMGRRSAGTAREDLSLGELFWKSTTIPLLQRRPATDSMLGTLYDIKVDSSSCEMTLDLADTTGAFCFLVGYDNAKKKGRIVVDEADLLIT